jgi:hypothetical protein
MGQHISSLFAGRDDMLQPWHNVTARGVRAARQGRLMLALVSHQQALRIAQDLLAMPTAQRADRAELQSDAGGTDLAAAQLARAHEVLMRLLCDPSVCRALRRAALRHSHVTHAGLLRYLHEYGPHPAITRALRAGCLSVATGSPTLH